MSPVTSNPIASGQGGAYSRFMRNRIHNQDWRGIENSVEWSRKRQDDWDDEEQDRRGEELGWSRPLGREDEKVQKVKGD